METDKVVYLVNVHVKNGFEGPFIEATRLNREGTRKESGNICFDLYQKQDRISEFLLYEVYKSQEASDDHKKTEHYAKWRETVESMMEKPRVGVRYNPVLAD